MRTGQLRRTIAGHRDWVCTVAFSPDGTTIAGGGCDWSFHRGHDWPRPVWRGPEIPQSDDPRSDNLCVAGRAGYHCRGGPARAGLMA
ncbi:MAG TPA: hypothetical protein VN961_21200 [Streptosporangiaceae bacterium]|nr:hypothetical protein [Streptosporangiaceae bacterium]